MNELPSRSEIYDAIDGERDYQDKKWIGPDGPHEHDTLAWLVYMRDYADEAIRVLSRKHDTVAVPFGMHTIRKIAAMGVAAMEQNGVYTRAEEGARPMGTDERKE